jgi:two-component system cell cycle sensor histidine kinase/response regulator CckA
VLLVEDDAQVRSFTAQVLAELGYKVTEASNGIEAMRLAAESEKELHLLITDLVMPQMSGRQLVDEMSWARPMTKVLFVSGYTEDAIIRNNLLSSDIDFLPKPFTPGELARKVRQILDRVPVQV